MKAWIKGHVYVLALAAVLAAALMAVHFAAEARFSTPRSAKVDLAEIAEPELASLQRCVKVMRDLEERAGPREYRYLKEEDMPLALEAAEIAARAEGMRRWKYSVPEQYATVGDEFYRLFIQQRSGETTLRYVFDVSSAFLGEKEAMLVIRKAAWTDRGKLIAEKNWGEGYYFTLPQEDYARLYEICRTLAEGA